MLDEYDSSETAWVEEVCEKIDAAIEILEHTAPMDGETFVNQILDHFQQQRQVQK